jgi:ubiquinone/menaquinone biosynthesis C-methylase UbiE
MKDGSAEMIEIAKTNHPELNNRIKFALLPNRLPFEDNSFDGIIAITVLQHLPLNSIPVALHEIFRVLKSDGIFLAWVFDERPDLDSESRDPKGRLMTLLRIDYHSTND